ncbi:MAG: hypothetical protein ACRD96_04545 [Bryobacteraceae bacterium]
MRASRASIVLAGLQAGVLGGVAMLAWLSVASVWGGRSIWTAANLLATTFYGEAALRRGFRWATLSGAAFQLVLAGALGVTFGFAVYRIQSEIRVALLGLLFGLAGYLVAVRFLFPHDGMLVAYVLLGLFLGRFPRFLRSLE